MTATLTAVTALVIVLALIAAVYFSVGRHTEPEPERLPLDRLGRAGVLHTIIPGADYFAQASAPLHR